MKKGTLLLLLLMVAVFALQAVTPIPMSSQPSLSYTENFSDIANWTNGFASGTGAAAFGSVTTNATGTIPDGVRISTATSTFVTGSTGGVQKGSAQSTPTTSIVLLTTGTTNNTTSAAIDFFMDFTGVNAGTLSYDWAVVFNSTGNRASSLRVYWSTNGTSFTELTAAQVLNFTNNVAGSGTISSVTLPADFNNCATARLRFYYHNGTGGSSGSRPKISIDNLNVTAVSAGANVPPSITNITKNPSSGYTSTTSVSVAADVEDSDGTVELVELRWGTSTGSYPNTINMSLDSDNTYAADSDITAQADGTTVYFIIYAEDDEEDYSISSEQSYLVNNPKIIATGSLNAFSAYVGEPSAYQTYTLSGNLLTANIYVQAPNGFELCTTAAGTYTSTLDLASSYNGLIYVRLAGTALGNYSGNIVHSSTGVSNVNLAASGSVTNAPVLLFEENFNYTVGTYLKDNGWSAHSGAGTLPPVVSSPGLSYTSYPSVSGLCGETTGNGEDVNRTFVSQSSGDIYCSFLINVTGTTEAGDYLFHLATNPMGSDFKAKLFVGRNSSNAVRFGLTKAANVGTAVSWTGYDYALNTTYLVVLKYVVKSGSANDEVYGWINPSFSGAEPAPMMTAVTSETDISGGVGAVAIRQSSADIKAKFDGIRVAKTWHHLFDQAVVVPGTPTAIGDVEIETDILVYFDDTLPITDPSIPFLPNAGNLVNPAVIVFSADSGTTDIVINVGAGTWYAVAYYNGGWQYGNPTPCNGPGTISFFDVPFGIKADVPVIISENVDPTLPVELSSFTAVLTAQNYVMIHWTTQSESNLTGYYIYRNTENNLQSAIRIDALIGATNTSNETNYSFADQEVESGSTYYYWLQYNEMNGHSNFHGPINITLSQNPDNPTPVIPSVTELLNAFPNPFNPTTRIPYTLKNGGDVKLEIYNLKGQMIWSYTEKGKAAGYYWKDWDGKDKNGNPVSSGVYYYRMTNGKYSSSKKVVLMK